MALVCSKVAVILKDIHIVTSVVTHKTLGTYLSNWLMYDVAPGILLPSSYRVSTGGQCT